MNIVISGASSGVGFEAVLELIGSGNHKIIALARSEDKLYKLQEIAFALNPGCMLYTAKFDIVHDDYENGLIPFHQGENWTCGYFNKQRRIIGEQAFHAAFPA
jgi:NADP-dependent 3-hydroxy acid dehydrogenase YdfG